jgi:hypothetical protein
MDVVVIVIQTDEGTIVIVVVSQPQVQKQVA